MITADLLRKVAKRMKDSPEPIDWIIADALRMLAAISDREDEAEVSNHEQVMDSITDHYGDNE